MPDPAPAAVADAPPGAPPPSLDEMMLAMDVVDTLRHQEGLAIRELGQADRDAALRQRLRSLYESQGLAVSDAILDAGIAALKESRFTYTPPRPGLAVTLATLWVRRAAVAKVAAILVVAVVAVVAVFSWSSGEAERAAEEARIELGERLPARLEAAEAAALAEARDTAAVAAVRNAVADARTALGRADAEAARAGIEAVERLRDEIVRTYEIRVVSRPGEPSGVFRIPDANEGARNYYLIVEAVGPSGDVLSLPVTSEEDQATRVVSRWGLRVPEAAFEAVRRDKEADGIVDDRVVGEKPRGSLDPVYTVRATGGAILEW